MPLSNGSFQPVHFAVAEQTGAIVREGSVDVSMLGIQSNGLGQIVLAQTDMPVFNVVKVVFPEDFSDDDYYWTGHAFAKYPPRPEGIVRWTLDGWVQVTQEVIPYNGPTLEQVRERTSIVKSRLLANMMLAGIITPEQMIEASTAVPQFMMPLMDTLPAEARAIAIVQWSSTTSVNRNDPVIIMAAYAMGLTDSQIDAMFEVKVHNDG